MKKPSQPLISVVIATHNSSRTIKKCLESIKNQTHENHEIIVVDSKYYDPAEQRKSREIIVQYARYFQDGPERSVQRNRGIRESKGDFILLLDQDMYLSSTALAECYETMKNSDCVALIIPEISIGEGFWTKSVALERYVTTYLERGANEFCRFFRKKDALSVGGYDPSIVGTEDADFHYKMSTRGKIGKVKSVIYHDEGKIDFFERVRKKFYYSRTSSKYFTRRPITAVTQFFPIKLAYIKHITFLLRDPFHTLGMITIRTAEVIAIAMGMILPKK